jgi:hypothetical protein
VSNGFDHIVALLCNIILLVMWGIMYKAGQIPCVGAPVLGLGASNESERDMDLNVHYDPLAQKVAGAPTPKQKFSLSNGLDWTC